MFCSMKVQVLWVFILLLYAQTSQAHNLIVKLRSDAFTRIERQLSAFIQKHDAMQQRITKFLRFTHREFQQEPCYNSTIDTFIIENDNDPYGNKELLDIQHYFKFLLESGQQSETSDKLETRPCKCDQIDENIQQSISNKLTNLTEELNTKLVSYTNLTNILIKTQNTEQNNLIIQTGKQLSEEFKTQIEMRNKSSEDATNNFNSNVNARIEQLLNSLTNTQTTSDQIKNKLDIYIDTFTTSQNQQTKLIKSGLPNSCTDAIGSGNGAGVYQILIFNKPTPAYCDQLGRMMIQHQMEGLEDFFNREWSQYRNGFGEPKTQYWLGLQDLHLLTNSRRYELHIIMLDFDNISTQFIYDHFEISDESDMYRLNKIGGFSGNESQNRLQSHINMPFSTFDKDNDGWENGSCANGYKCGWWYHDCSNVNLNKKVQTSKTEKEYFCLRWTSGTLLKESTMYIKLH